MGYAKTYALEICDHDMVADRDIDDLYGFMCVTYVHPGSKNINGVLTGITHFHECSSEVCRSHHPLS